MEFRMPRGGLLGWGAVPVRKSATVPAAPWRATCGPGPWNLRLARPRAARTAAGHLFRCRGSLQSRNTWRGSADGAASFYDIPALEAAPGYAGLAHRQPLPAPPQNREASMAKDQKDNGFRSIGEIVAQLVAVAAAGRVG